VGQAGGRPGPNGREMVRFVEPFSVWSAFAFPLAVFTGIGGVLWLVLTRDDAVRPIFRDGFGRSVVKVRRRTAAAILVPAWIAVAAWLYSARLAAPFHALERIDGPAGAAWVLHRERPWRRLVGTTARTTVPEGSVASFEVGSDLSRRIPRPCLVIVTDEGRRHRGAGVPRSTFERRTLPALEELGIRVTRR